MCAFGLIYDLVSAATGYLACVLIWGPKFYLDDIPAGKNVWLAVQAISSGISVFVVGTAFAFFSIRNRSGTDQLRDIQHIPIDLGLRS